MPRTWNPLKKEFYTETVNPFSEEAAMWKMVEPINPLDEDSMWRGQNNWLNNTLSDVSGAQDARDARDKLKQGIGKAEGIAGEGYGRASQMYDPYTGLAEVLPGLQQDVNAGKYMSDPFSFNYQDDPGQKFAREQGLAGVLANMKAQGLNESGAERKAIGQYMTGLAGQQYGQNRRQAYNEYQGGQNQLQNQYARQLGLAGMGMNAINQQAGMETGLAGIQADLALGRSQASANAHMADAQRKANLIGQGMGLAGTIGGAMIGGPWGAAAGGMAGRTAGGFMQPGMNVPEVPMGGYSSPMSGYRPPMNQGSFPMNNQYYG